MNDFDKNDQETLSKFIEYSLMLILKGFDEMEMKQRLDLIKYLGSVIDIFMNKMFFRISDLEKRINLLEEENNKKK